MLVDGAHTLEVSQLYPYRIVFALILLHSRLHVIHGGCILLSLRHDLVISDRQRIELIDQGMILVLQLGNALIALLPASVAIILFRNATYITWTIPLFQCRLLVFQTSKLVF